MSEQPDIERFDLLCAREVRPCLCTVVGVPDGGYVRWKDHRAAMQAKDAEIERLREIVALFVRAEYERIRMEREQYPEDRAAWRTAMNQTYGVLQRRPIVAELMRKYTSKAAEKAKEGG